LRLTVRAVITDIDMPIMDGVAMIQVMKRLNPDLRALVSTGLASSGHVEARKHELESLGVGAESILVKPYTTEKILRALHALLAK
jgi:YesN/AraC family two-component response regulator